MSHGSPRSLALRCLAAPSALLALACLAAALVSCSAKDPEALPCSSPSCIDMTLPTALGPQQRAPARFEHADHVKALGKDPCAQCHVAPNDGDMSLKGVSLAAGTTRSSAIDQYHELCIGCHQKRPPAGQKAGPELCGECHRGSSASAAQAPVAMDLSLHQRHVAAEDSKCEKCHHVYDQAAGKLVYRKGEESACTDCHGKADDGRKLSWQHAAHAACVGCHVKTAASGKKAGPTDCAGCHDPAKLRAVKRLDPIPRLDRGQGVWIWMRAPWATTATVVFPHEKHETATGSCTDCHHDTMRKCQDCHTDEGKAEGGWVTLDTAFHARTSSRSCVGCHERRAEANPECAGCHDGTVRRGTSARCAVCHDGGDHPRATADTNPEDKPAELGALPTSPDLPDKDLVIKDLAHLYQGAKMPHPKIIARLDKAVRANPLATTFHGQATTLCEGCHHHEAQRAKASRCTSCHGKEDEALRDRPSALQAYHRQCVDCHKRMSIKAVGCTDCHAKAAEANP